MGIVFDIYAFFFFFCLRVEISFSMGVDGLQEWQAGDEVLIVWRLVYSIGEINILWSKIDRTGDEDPKLINDN